MVLLAGLCPDGGTFLSVVCTQRQETIATTVKANAVHLPFTSYGYDEMASVRKYS